MKKYNQLLSVPGPYLLQLLSFLLFSFQGICGEVAQSNHLNKTAILNQSILTVTDNSYLDEVANPTWYAATRKHQVRLTYHREGRTDLATGTAWTYTVNYKIYLTSTGGTGTFETGTLMVSHTPGSTQDIYEVVQEHALNYGSVTMKVTSAPSVTGTPPDDIRLELTTVTERYMDLTASSAPAPLIYYNSTTSELAWGFVPGAEEYDVEWTFIDYQDTPPTFTNPEDPFIYKTPVRITTGKQFYELDRVYPRGKIYFRVRGVGRHIVGVGSDYTHLNYTDWGYKGSTSPLSPALSYTVSGSFEYNKNWSYTAAYAEEGKVKKGIGYSDGGGKSRQSIATMNSDNTVIVGENKYDLEGRPVIAILPTPVAVTSPLTALNYKGLFNPDASAGEYNNNDFQNGLTPLGNSSGAGKYYSALNPFTADPFSKYTDDAGGAPTSSTTDGGYPFTQVQYTRDNTGRVSKTTGGAGATHNLEQGHELSYFYGSANGTELHRMFGTNVGIAGHYKKNLAVDANKQMSISYYDQEERVIATCLTGASPANLVELDDNVETLMTVSLDDNNIVDATAHQSTTISNILNVLPNTAHTFSYDMKGVIYGFNAGIDGLGLLNTDEPPTYDSCKQYQSIPLCADCKYKLEISVTDPDGIVVEILDASVPVNILTRTFSNPDNANCESNQYDQNGVSFELTFSKIGNYSVSKKLTLDTAGIYAEIQTALIDAGLDATYKNDLINCYIAHTDFTSCDITCEQHCRTKVLEENPTWAAAPVTYAAYITAAVNDCEAANCNLNSYCEQSCSTQVLAANPTWDVNSLRWDETDHSADITAAVSQCVSMQCGGTACEVMMERMLADVSPGGILFASPLGPIDYCSYIWDRVEDKQAAYTLPALPAQPIAADLADPDYIIFLDANNLAIRPQPDAAFLQDPANWITITANPDQWKQQLVKAHSDNCHYQECVDGAASVLYDVNATQITQKEAAYSSGFLDPMGMTRTSSIYAFPGSGGSTGVSVISVTSGIDPMFATQSITAGSLYLLMADALSFDFSFNGYTDIWHYINDPTNPAYATGGLAFTDANKWILFRGLYLDKKNSIYNNWNTDHCPYCDNSNAIPITITGTEADIQNASNVSSDCADIANQNTTFWMDKLQHYADSSTCGTLTAADKIAIKHNLMLYCQSTCGMANPMGYITAAAINADVSTHVPDPSDAYLIAVQSILNTAGCSTALNCISAGDPYTMECPSGGFTVDATIVTDCFKELLSFINDQVIPITSTTCFSLNNGSFPLLQGGCFAATYLGRETSGFLLSSSSSCSPGTCSAHLLKFHRADGSEIEIADMLSINVPVYVGSSPATVSGSTFKNIQCIINSNKSLTSGTEGPIMAYLYESGTLICTPWTLTETDEVTYSCMAQVDPAANLDFPTDEELRERCIQNLMAQDTLSGTLAFNAAVTSFTEQYIKAHFNNCFSSHLDEDFNYQYNSNEYHYTLYYYDQAGNLTQTVPPKGVHLVPLTSFTNGVYNNTTEPAHTFLTRYTYNSLNQVVTQQTPDGGLTAYYYDDKGRLRFSQNAKQLANDAYSYTVYDNLSRITQVGESTQDYTGSTPFYNGVNDLTFPSSNQSQVTLTVYDAFIPDPDVTALFDDGNGQQFLRTRVAATAIYEGNVTDGISYASYYSYDEHGNVNELVQDNTLLASLGNDIQYKYMRYKYQLVSGNVKEVAYQPGKADQFYHKYIYDADNRLTIAMTSNHAPLAKTFDSGWEKDAKYFYYKHGPLARTETGEDKVQGTDYAYTINGWLKGINATTLSTSRDMGMDANLSAMGTMDATNNNNLIGADALGYTLGYFDGDYTSIGSTTWQATTTGTSLSTGNYKDLFNGNIARTTSVFMDNSEGLVNTMGKAYKYDQLNRLKTVNAFTNVSGATDNVFANNTFTSATDAGDYKELFSYDPNGNITTAERWGNGTKMDDFAYNYQDVAAGYADNTNRLRFVGDDVLLASNYTDDIDDQSATYGTGNENYTYDAIGNLTGDKKEEIASIDWNVYGKVASITRTSGSTKKDLVFKYDPTGNRICKIVKDRDASTGTKSEEHWTYTYYARDASGNVMAIYDRAVNIGSGTVSDVLKLKEHTIYGSERVGVETKDINLGGISFADGGYNTDGTFTRPTSGITTIDASAIGLPIRLVGDKNYELVNHLKNSMVVASDKKQGVDVSGSGSDAEYYLPQIISSQDFFAYNGMMPGRKFNETDYRFGAGTQEKDDEIYGSGNAYAAEYWEYDPRLGRRWDTDPVDFAWQSSYAVFNDNPVLCNDELGLWGDPVTKPAPTKTAPKINHDYAEKILRKTNRQIRNDKFLDGLTSTIGKGTLLFNFMLLSGNSDYKGPGYLTQSEITYPSLKPMMPLAPEPMKIFSSDGDWSNSFYLNQVKQRVESGQGDLNDHQIYNEKIAPKTIAPFIMHQHHIIPVAVFEKTTNPVISIARLHPDYNKWVNSDQNLLPLSSGEHGNHPAYSEYILERLGKIAGANPSMNIQQAFDILKKISGELKGNILKELKANPGKRLNQIYKEKNEGSHMNVRKL